MKSKYSFKVLYYKNKYLLILACVLVVVGAITFMSILFGNIIKAKQQISPSANSSISQIVKPTKIPTLIPSQVQSSIKPQITSLNPSPMPTQIPTLTPTQMPTPTPPIPKDIAKTIKIGQYLTLGKYYNEPIKWRCVDINENGPLMLSDRILTIKAFDGGSTHKYLDGTTQKDDVNDRRKYYGSNIWETSDIRSWLNSASDAGKVKWLDGSAPTPASLRNKINAYDKEKGFLAKGNFTSSEITFMKKVNLKSILSDVDASKLATGGKEAHKGISYTTGLDFPDVNKALQNYEQAYYQMVSDRVFILDIKDITRIYNNRKILGDDYYIGKPTSKLIENTKYRDPRLLSPTKNWHSYTRTPQGEGGYSILLIISMEGPYQKAGVFYDNANDFYIGIRPAFYLQ